MNKLSLKGRLLRRFSNAAPRRTFSSLNHDQFQAWEPLEGWAPFSLTPAVKFGDWDYDLRSGVIPRERQLPLGVATMRDMYVQGQYCRVLDRKGRLYTSSSWYGPGYREMGMRIAWSRSGFRSLEGRTLVLGSEWSGNYYHWMIDCLGKYALFLLAGGSPASIQNILLPRPPNASAQKFLTFLGIDQTKIVWLNNPKGFRTEEAVVPSYPGHRGIAHPKILQELASRLGAAAEAGGPGFHARLLITRDAWNRKLSNRAEIQNTVEAVGFRSYPLDDRLETQHIDFNRATHIVAQHGAALTNLLFARPGTKVVEIQSPDHPHAAFMSLCQALGLEYRLVWGTAERSQTPQWNSQGPGSELDVSLDPELLKQALENLV